MSSVFELGSLVDNVPGRVQCLDCVENKVYVGTKDGQLLVYAIERATTQSGQSQLAGRLVLQVQAHAKKKPVDAISIVEGSDILVVLIDNSIEIRSVATLETLDDSTTTLSGIKDNANCFCAIVKERVGVAICVATKKKLLFFKLGVPKSYAECVLSDTPLKLVWVKDKVWYSSKKAYGYVSERDMSVSEVCPASQTPLLARLTPKELVVTIGDNVGLTLDQDGQPAKRGTVTWMQPPIIDCVSYMWFTVALMQKCIEIHDIDELTKPIQTVIFSQSQAMCRCESPRCVVVASTSKLMLLLPVPVETQISQLFASGKTKEALVLFARAKARRTLRTNTDTARALQTEVGFAFMCECQFQEGVINFSEAGTDPRDVLFLFPDLFGSIETYSPSCSATPKDKIATIARKHLQKQKKPTTDDSILPLVTKAEECIIVYLQRWREKHKSQAKTSATCGEAISVVDDALVACFLKHDKAEDLEKLLQDPNNFATLKANEVLLRNHNYFHLLALLYCKHDRFDLALQTWLSLAKKEKVDRASADGYNEMIQFLKDCTDHRLVWTYSAFVLEANHPEAVNIFTGTHRQLPLKPDHVLEHLGSYKEEYTLQYLTHLIGDTHNTDPKYHTKLAVLLVSRALASEPQAAAKQKTKSREDVSLARQLGLVPELPITPVGAELAQLSSEAVELAAATSSSRVAGSRLATLRQTPRAQLLTFLSQSTLYDVQHVLSLVHGTWLDEESVFLFSRSGRHNQALEMIVWLLDDEHWAHHYCVSQTPANTQYPEEASKLLLVLLKIFLGIITPPNNQQVRQMHEEARRLLDLKGRLMDASQVLATFPSNTALSYLAPFLLRALPQQQAKMREVQIVKSLSKAELMNKKLELIELQSRAVPMPSTKTCAVCQRLLGTTVFAAYPNGVVVHYKCLAHPSVCPVTGVVFTADY